MSDDEVRVWVLGALLFADTAEVGNELRSPGFLTGYNHGDSNSGPFFRLVCRRVDAAFGFNTDPGQPATPRRSRPKTPAEQAPAHA